MDDKISLPLSTELIAAEAATELDAAHRAELRRLSDLAFLFLSAADGNPIQAVRLLDDVIELLFEGGVLSMWRYRIVLSAIHEGL